MSDSYDFSEPDRVLPGAVGEPGQRTFFLQVGQGPTCAAFKLEKQQVAALCEYLDGILADLPPVAVDGPTEVVPVDPAQLEWVVGALAVAYEEADDRILVVAEEFVGAEDDTDAELRALGIHTGEGPATARIRLTRGQVAAFIRVGQALVEAGRPPCPSAADRSIPRATPARS